MTSALIKENYNSSALVHLRGDFIDREKRRKGENGFLANTLRQYNAKRIFDACLGDGCDSLYLLHEGFDVISNDLDTLFIQKAQENAKKLHLTLSITQHDRRELTNYFPAESFDAVVCLGNSLSYVFGHDDQLLALKNFFSILHTNGVLIIDERNFQYVLDDRKHILEGGPFRYSNKYVYCGEYVHARPIEIKDDRVYFEYKDGKTDNVGHLTMYPFKKDELYHLLQEAGFKTIHRYSDYHEGYDYNADFYHYVCMK